MHINSVIFCVYENTLNEDGNVILPSGYFENVTEDKHILVRFETKSKNLIITKKDKDTNEIILNTKFAIYSVTPEKEIIDFAKNVNGEYIGEENVYGEYVVTTSQDGQIKLSLPVGYYKAVEVEAAEGYILEDDENLRTIYFRRGNVTSDFDMDYTDEEELIIENIKKQE